MILTGVRMFILKGKLPDTPLPGAIFNGVLDGYKFPLKDNEAYLFDAYTLMHFRGKGLAPYIRYQCYKELAKSDRHKLFSISNYFNTPSIKFKNKLNAKFLELRLSVELFRKWSFDLHLKKY